jgi:prepilin-type N-terminal cleavage/methylation domain-containing protein
MGRSRGYTLIEIMLAVGLFGFIMAVAIGYLVPSLHYSMRTSLRAEEEQQAVIALNRLVADSLTTAPSGFSPSSTAPLAVGICPLASVQADGTQVWSSSFIIYWYDASSGCLLRRQWPPGGPLPTAQELDTTTPRKLLPARLAQIVAVPATPAQHEIVMARSVQSFNIIYPYPGTDDLLVQPVQFKLVLTRSGNTGQQTPETLTYVRSVFVRNQRS